MSDERDEQEREEAIYVRTAQLTKLRIAYRILFDAFYGKSGRKDITTALNAIQRQIARLERESGVSDD